MNEEKRGEIMQTLIELGLHAVEVFSVWDFYEKFPQSEEIDAELRRLEAEDYINLLEHNGKIRLIGVNQKALDEFDKPVDSVD